jgi:hypothetical protein
MLLDSALLVSTIGDPNEEDVIYSRYLIGKIPEQLQAAIRDVFLTRCVVFAWLLDARPEIRKVQLEMLAVQSNQATVSNTLKLADLLANIDVQYRLPIAEIIQGTLVGLSDKQYRTFRTTVLHLIQADQQVNLFEFFLQHHLLGHLDRHFGHGLPHPTYFEKVEQLMNECGVLLGVLAEFGHDEVQAARQAFQAALKLLPPTFTGLTFTPGGWDYPKLAHAVKQLSHGSPTVKKQLLAAAAVSITFDHQISVIEAELYRALGVSLDCPVPPIMSQLIEQR